MSDTEATIDAATLMAWVAEYEHAWRTPGTDLNRADKYFMRASPAKTDENIEFFAEIDLLCALSTCPGCGPRWTGCSPRTRRTS